MCCVHRVSGAVKSSIQGTRSTVYQNIDLLTWKYKCGPFKNNTPGKCYVLTVDGVCCMNLISI